MVAAFEGWNDAGDAATHRRPLPRRPVGRRAVRRRSTPRSSTTSPRPGPRCGSIDDGAPQIDWPTNEISPASIPARAGRRAPHRHRAAAAVAHVLRPGRRGRPAARRPAGAHPRCAARRRAPHPTGRRSSARPTTRGRRPASGCSRSRYEGPTGIVGVLHESSTGPGSVRIAVGGGAAYLPGTPSPKAALALVERTGELLGVAIPSIDLQIARPQYERQVDEVVEADDDMRSYVRQLELSHDEGDDGDDEDDEDDETAEPRRPVPRAGGAGLAHRRARQRAVGRRAGRGVRAVPARSGFVTGEPVEQHADRGLGGPPAGRAGPLAAMRRAPSVSAARDHRRQRVHRRRPVAGPETARATPSRS